MAAGGGAINMRDGRIQLCQDWAGNTDTSDHTSRNNAPQACKETSLMIRALTLVAAAAVSLSGCASLPHTDSPKVMVVDIEPAAGSGLEARMLVTLRIQNPNNTPIDFNGIYVELNVLDKSFASGVSDQSGTVPPFGEAVIDVPVTVSVMEIVGQALGILGGKPLDKFTYEMSGKLNSASGTLRFKSQGELKLPASSPTDDM
jgi:LEA14-like dessication related protein